MIKDKRRKYPELGDMTEADFIKQAIERWDEGERFLASTIKNGLLALRAIRGDEDAQWDAKILRKRKDQKRPTLIENMLPAFLRQVEGDFRLNTPAVKVALDSLDADPEVANLIQGKIYYTLYKSQAKAVHQDTFEQVTRTGFGVWGLGTRYKDDSTFDQEVYLRLIENHLSARWDPASKLPDTSDKQWFMLYDALTKEAAKKRWPKANWSASASEPTGANKTLFWADDKYGIIEYWYFVEKKKKTIYQLADGTETETLPEGEAAEGVQSRTISDKEIYSCIINGNEILEGPTRWVITKTLPWFIVTGDKMVVDGEVSFKSLVADVIGLQQLHNYFITTLTETVALQPQAKWKATVDEIPDEYRAEWDGTIDAKVLTFQKDPSRPNGPTLENPPALPQGLWMMPQYTKTATQDTIGIHEAGLGKKSNEQSGVAIRERRESGDVGTYVFTSNFQRTLEHEGRCLIEAIQYLDAQPGKHVVMGIDGEQKMSEIEQSLDKGRYNLIVTIGPSMTSQRQEARAVLMDLLQPLSTVNAVGVSAMAPKLIKAFDMPDAHEIADILASTLPPELRDKFYPDEKQKEQGGMNIPPELVQQIRQAQEMFEQNMTQAQEIIGQLQAENAQLKTKADVELQKAQIKAASDEAVAIIRAEASGANRQTQEQIGVLTQQVQVIADAVMQLVSGNQ